MYIISSLSLIISDKGTTPIRKNIAIKTAVRAGRQNSQTFNRLSLNNLYDPEKRKDGNQQQSENGIQMMSLVQ